MSAAASGVAAVSPAKCPTPQLIRPPLKTLCVGPRRCCRAIQQSNSALFSLQRGLQRAHPAQPGLRSNRAQVENKGEIEAGSFHTLFLFFFFPNVEFKCVIFQKKRMN